MGTNIVAALLSLGSLIMAFLVFSEVLSWLPITFILWLMGPQAISVIFCGILGGMATRAGCRKAESEFPTKATFGASPSTPGAPKASVGAPVAVTAPETEMV